MIEKCVYVWADDSIHYDMKRKKKYVKNKPPKHSTEKYSDGLRQKITEKSLPAEVLLRESLMTVVGRSEVWIENYKALLEYREGQVLVQAADYVIKVEGTHLCISHYMEEHMMICGNIRSITYL